MAGDGIVVKVSEYERPRRNILLRNPIRPSPPPRNIHVVAAAPPRPASAGYLHGITRRPRRYASWSAANYYGAALKACLKAAGAPEDLVQIVHGYGPTGAALVGGGVDKVIFVGSPGIGAKVMEHASKTLTPVVLELGGKDPFVVCDDVGEGDLDRIAQIALRGVFQSMGRTPERAINRRGSNFAKTSTGGRGPLRAPRSPLPLQAPHCPLRVTLHHRPELRGPRALLRGRQGVRRLLKTHQSGGGPAGGGCVQRRSGRRLRRGRDGRSKQRPPAEFSRRRGGARGHDPQPGQDGSFETRGHVVLPAHRALAACASSDANRGDAATATRIFLRRESRRRRGRDDV